MSQENKSNEELDFNIVLDEFREAVYNGQVRLALEKLLTIVDVFVEILSSDPEEKNETQPEQKQTEEVKKAPTETVEKHEPVVKKTSTKQPEAKIEE